MQTPVPPGTDTDQLFVNGKRQILARYPNYDPNAKYLNGWAEDAISPERVKRWADPRGGYIHALHEYLCGSFHYEITGKDADGNLTYEGGWQTNRPASMHKQTREPLLRSDWRIYRGGALFFASTEDCRVEDCNFDQLGGNCIFVSNYNRPFHAMRCHLTEAGANGIAFVGDPNAVRNALFSYDERHAVDELDLNGKLSPEASQEL